MSAKRYSTDQIITKLRESVIDALKPCNSFSDRFVGDTEAAGNRRVTHA
jgi:hypothetical protein